MTTLDHRPPEGTEYTPYQESALGFLSQGLTAEIVRDHAGSAFYVERTARCAGITPGEAYAELLLIADAIEAWEAEGLTPEQAYSRVHGPGAPYPGPTAA